MSLSEIHQAFLTDNGKGVWRTEQLKYEQLIKQYGDDVVTGAVVRVAVQNATQGWTIAMVQDEIRRTLADKPKPEPAKVEAVAMAGETPFGREMKLHLSRWKHMMPFTDSASRQRYCDQTLAIWKKHNQWTAQDEDRLRGEG